MTAAVTRTPPGPPRMHVRPAPRTVVILVSWNTRLLLQQALLSIRRHSGIPVNIVVIDNASSDGSPEMAKSESPEATVVVNDHNLGFGQANNQGMACSDEPFILLLNSDAELQEHTLPTLVDELESHPECGAIGAHLAFPDGRFQSSGFRFPSLGQYALELLGVARAVYGPDYPNVPRSQTATPGEVDWVSGACMLLRRAAIAAVGGFDPAIHMYSEETDLCRRLWDAGYSVRQTPHATATHHVGRSTRQRATDQPTMLWSSRLLYFRKHHPRWQCAALRALIGIGYTARWLVWSLRSVVGQTEQRQAWRRRAQSARAVVAGV